MPSLYFKPRTLVPTILGFWVCCIGAAWLGSVDGWKDGLTGCIGSTLGKKGDDILDCGLLVVMMMRSRGRKLTRLQSWRDYPTERVIKRNYLVGGYWTLVEGQRPQISSVNPIASRIYMASVFPVVHTTIDTSSESFVQNKKDWEIVLQQHEDALRWCINEGQDKYVKRHIDRGMLLCISPSHFERINTPARDRINLLLDPDTPFLELCIFAGYKQSGSSPSASITAGIGIVKYPPQSLQEIPKSDTFAVA